MVAGPVSRPSAEDFEDRGARDSGGVEIGAGRAGKPRNRKPHGAGSQLGLLNAIEEVHVVSCCWWSAAAATAEAAPAASTNA